MWYRAGKQVLSNQTWPENDLKRLEEEGLENDLKRHEEDLEGPRRKTNKNHENTGSPSESWWTSSFSAARTQDWQDSKQRVAKWSPIIQLLSSHQTLNVLKSNINFLNFWTRRLNHVHQLLNFINISTRTCLVLSPITLAATGRYRCEVLGDRSYC